MHFWTSACFCTNTQGARLEMLHSHWQRWVEELSPQVCDGSWNTNLNIRNEKHKEFYHYVDEVVNATYTTKLNFSHKYEDSEESYGSSGNEDCQKGWMWGFSNNI
jgi:hypothetical protein